ncbi:granulocyte colony-stimulating factor receptor [Coregonus clupeaformis]|uniref:granulocyte colony-stimulating factor receptor n=1 Tax=Coregonus clupeaformis TaxID=59861 RepID=UPI001E1C79C6|nr:granulocyte colony-stimulating factor receptor [Coregonus clupeaformis]XP_041759597.2 granulocyte colony-stimulating factor receptor [Coregonus clupeaformis]
MASAWIAMFATLLLAFVNGTKDEVHTSPSVEVHTSTPVVALGSPVTASCVIRDDCPLIKGQAVHIVWHLNQRLIPSGPAAANESGGNSAAANESGWISTVLYSAANQSGWNSTVSIPSFTDTRGYLTCCVLHTFPCQIVGAVEIRAGFPPPAPQNLSCLTNLTKPETLSCQWDPGQDTHLPTQYTLHTEIRDLQESNTYVLPPGAQHYRIPRTGFVLFSEIEIYVKAVNALGQATSTPLLLEPMKSAKFDPPKVLKVQAEPNRYGCLRLSWCLSEQQAWVTIVSLEVRQKTANSKQWSEEPVPVPRLVRQRPMEVCRLLHGTEYHIQIRVRYHQSPWSEWSNSNTAVTLERAPTGRLDYWMTVSGEQRQKHLSVHLLWKPSKQFRANGKILSYVVSLQRQPTKKLQLCVTLDSHCVFQLHRGARKVFLSAGNAAGASSPTEVEVFQHRALAAVSDVNVLPHDERSLLVQWTSIHSSSVTGYVVEWRPLWKMDPSLILFDHIDRNQSSTLISESIEPYKPYGISVYPRYKEGIGLPQTIEAYSRQKAPSAAPNLRVRETLYSRIELTWEEIPLCQRNGIVQSYQIFYWDEQGNTKVVTAELEKRRVVLEELNPSSSYKAFIMVSTGGGSLNGSEVTLKTEPMDVLAIIMIVISSGVGLSLLVIISVLACFSTHERLKMCFWPMIPDPANSSIKRWSTSDSMQDIPPVQDMQESSLVYLSHLSLLDLPKKGLEKRGGQITDDPWCRCSDTSDLGESICGSPHALSPSYLGSHQHSVPYATVVFDSPYSSQPPSQSHAYLRSESTQPLLEDELEEPSSPKEYQNVPVRGASGEQVSFRECQDDGPGKGELCTLWDDFPLLRALAMNDVQSET